MKAFYEATIKIKIIEDMGEMKIKSEEELEKQLIKNTKTEADNKIKEVLVEALAGLDEHSIEIDSKLEIK